MATRPASAVRVKKQNHANIPCPIENCARFTYGKLPDHLTKRHGITGPERDTLNEQQRKRFFNGELCQVRFLKETAIRDLWGRDYDDPSIRAKIHESYALVKIRIIPLSASCRPRPLTEQDANILTNFNARTAPRVRRSPPSQSPPAKRRKSCDSSEEENATASIVPTQPSSLPSPPPSPPAKSYLNDEIESAYKSVINDMKKSMIMGRTLAPRKKKIYRTYRRYAKRLITFLHRHHSPLHYDVDLLLCEENPLSLFFDAIKEKSKPKTLKNYIVAAIKLFDSRLFAIETDPIYKEKVRSMTLVYNFLLKELKSCENMFPQKNRGVHNFEDLDTDPTLHSNPAIDVGSM